MRVLFCGAFTVFGIMLSGCYQSTTYQWAEPCMFGYSDARTPSSAVCEVDGTSPTACLDAAICLCQARHPQGVPAELTACVDEEMGLSQGADLPLGSLCELPLPLTFSEILETYAAAHSGTVSAPGICAMMTPSHNAGAE